jgi:hypothetical protein
VKGAEDAPLVRLSTLSCSFQTHENSWPTFSTVEIVVGCKGDAEKNRKVSETEAADWAHLHRAKYFKTSSETGLNVEDVFNEAVRLARGYQLLHPSEKKGKDAKQRTNCALQ